MRKCFVILVGLSLSLGSISSAQTAASKDLLSNHVYTLAADSMMGRAVGSKQGLVAANYISKQLELVGVKPYQGRFSHPFSFKQGPVRAFGNNVIGIIEGSDPNLKNEYIVIGAHYDHIGYDHVNGKDIVCNGADDNASGVATIIELGRLLVLQKEMLKRSVIIIGFDGEESGLRGSTALVNDSIIPIDKVKLMVSVDMVGMLKANKRLNLKGSATIENGDAIFMELARKHGFELTETGSAIENRTDTYPFGKLGIPAIAPTTGVLSPYHQPGDDANLLDYEGMATVTDFLLEAVLQFSGQESLVPSKAFSNVAKHGSTKRFTAGIKGAIGRSKQDYPDEFFQGKALFAAQVGVYARVMLSKRLFLQPEVQYETMGSKTANGNMRTHALNTPCNLLFALINNDMVDGRVCLVLGGYHSYTFAGNVGGKSIDFDNHINRSDYGLSYGISLEAMGYQFGCIVKRGLTDILNSNTPGNVRNTAAYLTFGYRF